MTINERVFRQNINNGPSIVTYHLSLIYQFIHHFIATNMWVIKRRTRLHVEGLRDTM